MLKFLRLRNIVTARSTSVTLPWVENVYGGFIDVMEENLGFLNTHGPTADQVTKGLDLSNKTCLITGANSGIGLEMTRCLSSKGCTVLMACRNTYAAGVIARNACEMSHLLRFYEVNLASLKSVNRCSETIVDNHSKIDILILNAAVFGLPWTLTEDGLETIFQVNYLSQYYLLMNIEKVLAPDARVVFMSSESHRHVKWDFQEVLAPYEEKLSLPSAEYTSIRAYNASKLCGLLAMHYLEHCWRGSGRSVFCAHPGSFVKTSLSRNWWPYDALYTFMKPFTKSVSQAASTPVFCATSPTLKGATAIYVKDCKKKEESDLAKDSYLSFRVMDLTNEIIKDRVAAFSATKEDTKEVNYQEVREKNERAQRRFH